MLAPLKGGDCASSHLGVPRPWHRGNALYMTQPHRAKFLNPPSAEGWVKGLRHLKLNLSSKVCELERSCLNCRAVLIWGSDCRQRVPTAVPMGSVSGKAPAQNEQRASGLNLAGADMGTGLARVTRSPHLRGPERGCSCRDRVGRSPWKPSCSSFPGTWSSDRKARLHRAPSPLGSSSPSQSVSRAHHRLGLGGARRAEGPRKWQ